MESSTYDKVKHENVQMGSFWVLINNGGSFLRYLRGIVIGLPVWNITSAEQFGTNPRATAAISISNLVKGFSR